MSLWIGPIIAAVVGGCLLTGGYGSAIGATIGSAIIGMVQGAFNKAGRVAPMIA